MSKNIAIEVMTLQVDNPIVTATISITGSPSQKVKAGSKVYQDGLAISVANITAPSSGATIPDPGPYNVNMISGATKVKAENKLVLLLGDKSGTINATPKIPNSPSPIDFPVSFKVEITNAGQIKAKAV